MVVLVDQKELQRSQDFGWRQYRSGKGSNKALFERCQHSTEFHFPDIESQLTLIEQDFASRSDGLQEGSFFVTRHSNLPLTQVVFHLIIHSEGMCIYIYLVSRHRALTNLKRSRSIRCRAVKSTSSHHRSSQYSRTRCSLRYLITLDTFALTTRSIS